MGKVPKYPASGENVLRTCGRGAHEVQLVLMVLVSWINVWSCVWCDKYPCTSLTDGLATWHIEYCHHLHCHYLERTLLNYERLRCQHEPTSSVHNIAGRRTYIQTCMYFTHFAHCELATAFSSCSCSSRTPGAQFSKSWCKTAQRICATISLCKAGPFKVLRRFGDRLFEFHEQALSKLCCVRNIMCLCYVIRTTCICGSFRCIGRIKWCVRMHVEHINIQVYWFRPIKCRRCFGTCVLTVRSAGCWAAIISKQMQFTARREMCVMSHIKVPSASVWPPLTKQPWHLHPNTYYTIYIAYNSYITRNMCTCCYTELHYGIVQTLDIQSYVWTFSTRACEYRHVDFDCRPTDRQTAAPEIATSYVTTISRMFFPNAYMRTEPMLTRRSYLFIQGES